MTKKTKQTYPVEYVEYDLNGEYIDDWGIAAQVHRLIEDAKRTPHRWGHLLLLVDAKTVALVLTRPVVAGSDTYGVTLAYATFDGADRMESAAKALQKEVGEWVRMHGLQPQPVKELGYSDAVRKANHAERAAFEATAFESRKVIQAATINGVEIQAVTMRSALNEGYFEARLIKYQQGTEPTLLENTRIALDIDSADNGGPLSSERAANRATMLFLRYLPEIGRMLSEAQTA